MSEKAEKQATALDKLKNAPEATSPEATPDTPDTPTVTVTEVNKEYQAYQSKRISTCFVSPMGHRINFTDYHYYTKDPDVIAYLDSEIEAGSRAISKGEMFTAEELNPEAAKRRQIIEEFKNSQEGRDFSQAGAVEKLAAEGKAGGEGTGMVGSDQVAN